MNTENYSDFPKPPTFWQIIVKFLKQNKGFFIGLVIGAFIATIVLMALGYQILMPEITNQEGQKQRVPFYQLGLYNDGLFIKGLCEIKPDISVCPKQ